MPSEITMPALSPTMEKGNLARWLVREGDPVRAGDLLAEIETDKATLEFEASGDGVVSRIIVAEGTDDVPVGTVIMLIGEPSDGFAERLTDAGSDVAGPGPAAREAPALAPAGPSAPRPDPIPVPASTGDGAADRRRASPLAARIATHRGIDLAAIRGTGAGGRIVRADLGLPPRALPANAPTPPAAATPRPSVQPPPDIPHEVVKLTAMRRTIARRLTEAKQTIPHFYLGVDVRLDALQALRRELNASRGDDRGVRLSVNDFLIKALAIALEQTPDANVQFGGDQLYRFRRVDISVAVAVPAGLVTPVLVDAAGKRLSRLAREARDLAARARDGKLAPEDYQGGTASLSNLGMFGMREIIPVLSPPQAVIVGVGAAEERYRVTADGPVASAVMSVTGSFDHRAIDGATGAELMRTLKELLERPTEILV